MYICKNCNCEFFIPEMVNIDVGGIPDRGCVRRFEHPAIKVCPQCRSMNYENKELIQEVS